VRFGSSVRFLPVGPADREVGAPTQMGAFVRDGQTSGEDLKVWFQ
jgi:hypothetical protein